MSRPSIDASVREGLGKGPNRRLRAAGQVPGVLYGNGNEPTALSFQPKEVVKLLEGPLGRNTVANVTIDGASRLAIIKDYQVHPWKRKLLHVDFMEITESTPLTLKVPFKRVGHSPAEKLGAKVEQHRDIVKIRCTAANIPAAVEFDMTTLVGDFAEVSISDVTLPEGVEAVFRKEYKLLRMKVPSAAALAAAEEDEAGEAAGGDAGEEASE